MFGGKENLHGEERRKRPGSTQEITSRNFFSAPNTQLVDPLMR
jgi:hypothetical protein